MPPRCSSLPSVNYGKFLDSESMKIKKGRKITFADINGVFGNVVKLASLIYELYKIVAHR